MEQHSVVYENKKIDFILIRKNVRNINLRTKADMSVVVSANKNVPLSYILDLVAEKAPWILKNQEKYSKLVSQTKKTKEYVDGEDFPLLGRRLRLKVIEAKHEEVKLNGDFLEVHVKNKDNFTRKRNLVRAYYKAVIKEVLSESLAKTANMAGLSFVPEMKVRSMVSRWGSCVINKKKVILNSALIQAPKCCIDYVVLHELLHFGNPRHDKKFYQTIASYMPDWKERKLLLGQIVLRVK
jgi:predicted metal-dependent hydrolase